MSDIADVPLLIVFANFNRYTAQVERLDDLEVARVMNDWYASATARITSSGGRVVKFMGDAVLAVYPQDRADDGILALADLKVQGDRFMQERGWECYLIGKAHFGSVAAGDFGPPGDRRYDILGKAVNTTVRLESKGVALSAEAFRQLSPETRKRFKKHTPPLTYIRLEESHRR